MLIALLIATIPLLTSTAQAWPDAWNTVYRDGVAVEDAAGDIPEEYRTTAVDIVGTVASPSLLWYVDVDRIYFAMNVDNDPAALPWGAWGFLFSTDATLEDYEFSLACEMYSDNYEIHGYQNTSGNGASDSANAVILDNPTPGTDDMVLLATDSTTSSTPDYLVALSLPTADFLTYTGLTLTSKFRVAVATNRYSSGQAFETDLAGTTDTKDISPLEDALSDEITIDADSDGLYYSEEIDLGTNPDLRDSDKDGLDDKTELDLKTDPLNADSDDDHLDDGDEIAFGTNPMIMDSDADGINDNLEYACDPTRTDKHNENDRDGDGIPEDTKSDEPTEGLTDTDQDGTADFCDDDSDDDGLSDADEGTGDEDCDGILNFQDRNDADGPCLGNEDTHDTGASETEASSGCTCASFRPTHPHPFAALFVVGAALIRKRRR
jgi:hypothetical protein